MKDLAEYVMEELTADFDVFAPLINAHLDGMGRVDGGLINLTARSLIPKLVADLQLMLWNVPPSLRRAPTETHKLFVQLKPR